jgi:hypothetical protein
VFSFFYGIYFIILNFIFDLIIAYVDVYARKLRVFYDSTLIDDINELRKVFLFTNFKQNFLKNFVQKKDVVIEGLVYKEELNFKFVRIF